MGHDSEISISSLMTELVKIQDKIKSNSSQGLPIDEYVSDLNTHIIEFAESLMEYGERYIYAIELLTEYAKKFIGDIDDIDYDECENILLQITYNVDIMWGEERTSFFEYYKANGVDNRIRDNYDLYKRYEQKVFIVDVDCPYNVLDIFLKDNYYSNFEIINWDIFIRDLYEGNVEKYSNGYVSFIENNFKYDVWKLFDTSMQLATQPEDMVISFRALESKTTYLQENDQYFIDTLPGGNVDGKKLLEACVYNRLNLYGCLSNIIFRGNILKQVSSVLKSDYDFLLSNRLAVLFYILMVSSCAFSKNIYILKKLHKYNQKDSDEKKEKFIRMITEFVRLKLLDLPHNWLDKYESHVVDDVKKEITVYYTDSAEYFCAKPIADYAESHGYKTKFTKDVHEKSEIGIYCQHVCYPENSKISVIMLHDMAQRHNIWPNIWQAENWNNFTFGVLPGQQWAERWQESASLHYVRPLLGTYTFGYPKGDAAFSDEIKNKASKVRKSLKYDFTVLYAPSWENDGKEDDFVRLLHTLPINLIIKQVPVPDDPLFKFVADNIAEMRKKHEGKYDNLTYVEQDENILVALAACDLVVSDESSVMTEATFFGKPSVAVTDWLIPDVKPSRYAIVPVEYVIKIKLEQLQETVRELSTNKEKYEEACQMGRDFFVNRGKASSDIVEFIDCIVENKSLPQNIMEKKLIPDYELVDMWN
ncbi:MAG: hypothetical protein J6N55_01850 [Anaerovibrio sp.]|uniref:hypothetical protein n=1 Tax=Anaerovibrio sp. TaxID=1872532 RepID=UPI001B2A9C70|nr:hypothetical protein [Anaerovibrio sp.]MBO6245007.1 hypothetical protein [Anaerovibrio sp.]MBP3817111.1 hypothetical protein [Butyrivibrio sp.]